MKRTYYTKTKRLDKFSKEEKIELSLDLINSFAYCRNLGETAEFLSDLFTVKEIENLSKRLRIAKLLMSGNTHEEVITKTHSSFGTVAKVSIWLREKGSGFRNIINKLPPRYNLPKNIPRGPIEFHLPQTLLALTQYAIYQNQTKKLNKFLESTRDKKHLDENIRKDISENYISINQDEKRLKTKTL